MNRRHLSGHTSHTLSHEYFPPSPLLSVQSSSCGAFYLSRAVQLWDTRYINQPLQAAGQPHGAPTRCRTPPSPLSPTNSNACSSSTPCSSPSPSPSTPRSSPFSQDRLGSGSASRRSSSGGLHRGKAARGRRRAALPFGRVTGGDSVAEETLCQGGRACGVSSVHACDDGSKIAVSRVTVL